MSTYRIPFRRSFFFAVNNLDTLRFPAYGLQRNEQGFYPLVGRKEDVTTLYLGFEQPPLGGPIKILFSMEENLPTPMPLLQFEYSSGRGWNTLNVIDETENFRKTGILTMRGNPDFARQRLLGRERYWIRITDANNEYYQLREKCHLQNLEGIYMNTTQISAVETQEPEWFFISPNEENKECQLRNRQIYGIRVWVNEYRSLHRDELPALEKEHTIRYEHTPDGEVEAIWVEWQETSQLGQGDASDRCYEVDRIEGTVRFPNGRNGRIPTSDSTATICIEYSCGGGSIGNLPKHSIQRLNRSIGFISEADNYEITTGGCDQEQVQEALLRNAEAIRHGYRAVTVSDYEALAKEADRNILRTKCFSNRNALGQREYGHVTLVVLQKDYENGRKYFDSVRGQIMEYMKDRMSTHLFRQNRFHIIEPDFLELSTTVTLQVTEYNQVFEVRSAVLERLKSFLNPVMGNYDRSGWEIGSVPNATQILNALKEIPGIHYIESVRLTVYQRGKVEVDLDKANQRVYALPLNGSHEIIVKVRNN